MEIWKSARATVFPLLLCAFVPATAAAQAVTIDFENLQPGLVLTQYASQGVTFNGPQAQDYSSTPGFAHSGTKAIEVCFAAEFCTTPLNISFTTAQARVKVWVGASSQLSQATTVILRALDQNAAAVGQVSAVLGPSAGSIAVQTPLEFTSASANIRQVVVTFDGGGGQSFNNGLVIDDLEFDTAGPPPACGTTFNPVLSVAQPQNNETVQINEFMLQGTVASAVPLDEARLTVAGSGGTHSSDLLGTIVPQTGGSFGATRISGSLFPGSNTVTLLVRNCHGVRRIIKTVVFSPIAAGTSFKFLGLEVTQATQDLGNHVPLVSDKPTMVRVYLQVEGPTTSIAEVTGAITATPPGGTPLVPLLHSINAISVDASTAAGALRLDLASSLNFILPPEWTAGRTLHFELSKLYIQDAESNLPCNGCGNLDEINAPRYAHFNPTRPLNLILAPYIYTTAQGTVTPDILFTPMGALQWLNNVYPLSGSFPADSSGLRVLRTLPMRTTTRDLHDDDDMDEFLDDLQDVLNSLQSQSSLPAGVQLFGVTPCGCGGVAVGSGGRIAYGDAWAVENALVPNANFEAYGSIWAQEIAHNFGRVHASISHGELPPADASFPYPHGGIGEPGVALTTEWWNGSPFLIAPGIPSGSGPYPHAHDFMSYGEVNNSTGEHTNSWVSPETYGALFQKFQIVAQAQSTAAVKPADKLVVAGHFKKDGTVKLRPFHIATTSFAAAPGTAGEFSVELVGPGGRTLATHRFAGRTISESDDLAFSEFAPWNPKTQVIVFRSRGRVVAKRDVSRHTPWVRITSPKSGDTWGAKATVAWEAGDEDGDPLTFTVLYNDGRDPTWLPIASGVTKLSAVIDTALLPGSERAQIRVRVSDGVNTAEAQSPSPFIVPGKRPLVAILSPRAGQQPASPDAMQFIGAAYDPEDGMLPASSLTWTSDRDGLLGHGSDTRARALSRGTHVITLHAIDKDGHSSVARVSIVVGAEVRR